MDALHIDSRLRDFVAAASKPLVVILGPTASGKTAYSIELATKFGGEIVNADSRQLYRHMNIGTAKITAEEMRGIPHHLLDVLDPNEHVTAAWFKRKATEAINDILKRKKIPMLVGGSMLYISAITDDLQFPTEEEERLSLQDRKKMKPRDDLFIIGIERPKDEVRKRINDRTRELFKNGWIEEVKALLKNGYSETDPGMMSHGYREIMQYLKSGAPSLDELPELIASKTRQYAKRQMTWWKYDPRIHWITP